MSTFQCNECNAPLAAPDPSQFTTQVRTDDHHEFHPERYETKCAECGANLLVVKNMDSGEFKVATVDTGAEGAT